MAETSKILEVGWIVAIVLRTKGVYKDNVLIGEVKAISDKGVRITRAYPKTGVSYGPDMFIPWDEIELMQIGAGDHAEAMLKLSAATHSYVEYKEGRTTEFIKERAITNALSLEILEQMKWDLDHDGEPTWDSIKDQAKEFEQSLKRGDELIKEKRKGEVR